MSGWNYRVFRHVFTDPITKRDGDYYAIHECYYDNNGDVNGWTKHEVGPTGETFKELKASYEMMSEAFNKPILEYNND